MVVKDVNMPKANDVSSLKKDPASVDDVQKVAEHISVVTKVTGEAAKLVGLEKLEKERKDMEEKLEQTRAELEKQRMETLNKELAEIKAALKTATEQRDLPAIKELERKLDEAKEALHREQLDGLRQELQELRKSGKASGDIGDEFKRVKQIAQELGFAPSQVTATPPEILLQMKKMENDLQVTLEQMRDDRAGRDRQWELEKIKWQEERELRQSEIQQKYEVEKDKTETLKSGFDRALNVIGRALAEEEETPGQVARQYHVEAIEGEMGEFSCPKCASPVAIAPDTKKAICASCGFSAPVKRVPGQPAPAETK